MTTEEIILGIIWVIAIALLYSFLDRKYEWFRIKPIYREVFWQNFLVNLVVAAVIYFVVAFLFEL